MESVTKETYGSHHPDAEKANMEHLTHVDVVVMEKHGTEIDARDMKRMGKTQSFPAQLRLLLHSRLLNGPHVLVGDAIGDRDLRLDQRRHGRCHLHLPCHVLRVWHGHCLHGRDGLHGSYRGRAVPLGFRVRGAERTEVR